MGLYVEHVLPRLMARSMETEMLAPLRRRVCAGLSGDVIELGFGSGANVAHYPAAVERVWAVEPSETALRLAAERIEASPARIERGDLDGQRLGAPDAAFDHALSTLTLCTVPDAAAALAELRRVLKPGGTLHFLEHGLADDESVRRWQRRLDPVHRRVAGGCRLPRAIRPLLEESGFRVAAVDSFYLPSVPRVYGYMTVGLAVA